MAPDALSYLRKVQTEILGQYLAGLIFLYDYMYMMLAVNLGINQPSSTNSSKNITHW